MLHRHTCRGLLHLCCTTVANIIKGKTPAEIREYFHIVNDFSPEEQEEVLRENQCAPVPSPGLRA